MSHFKCVQKFRKNSDYEATHPKSAEKFALFCTFHERDWCVLEDKNNWILSITNFSGLEEFIQRQKKIGNFQPKVKKEFHMSFDAESKRVHEESLKPTVTNKQPEFDVNWLNEKLKFDEEFKPAIINAVIKELQGNASQERLLIKNLSNYTGVGIRSNDVLKVFHNKSVL